MPNSFFESQFEQSYEFVQTLYLSRQQSIDYSWLLTDSQGLVPDYFTIQTMGRNPIERFFNRSMGLSFGSYSISFKVIVRFVDLFYMIGWLDQALRHQDAENDQLDSQQIQIKTGIEWLF